MSEDDTYDSPARNPSPPPEFQENEEVSFGDNIGHTAFSKHWLFTTLMNLIEEVDKGDNSTEPCEFGLDVSEDLQNELCKLWDMSMNSDVAVFLQEFRALDILTGVISKSKSPRVTEICVGILGNLACNDQICQEISNNSKLVDLILALLNNPDPPTLVETSRLLYACLSNQNARKTWVSSIKASEDFVDHICFILQSSTNGDLLNNVAEFVDTLLDAEDEICSSWASPTLVDSLLEAIRQVGCTHSATLNSYLHILQLMSATETGVEALLSKDEELQVPLMKYICHTCVEEIIVALEGHEQTIASALSVLNVLYSSSNAVFKDLTKDELFIRCLLKILEPLFPRIRRSSAFTPSEESDDNSNNSNADASDTDDISIPPVNNKGESKKESNGLDSQADAFTKNSGEVKDAVLLYNVIQGFLRDMVESLPIDESFYLPMLLYLDASCCRNRINNMVLTLRQALDKEGDPVDHLINIAHKHNLPRLSRIIDDVLAGKIISWTESDNAERT